MQIPKQFFTQLHLVLFAAGMLLAVTVKAQQPPAAGGTDDIAPENIDIVKPYEPVLADAVKVEFLPDLPTKEELEKRKPSFSGYMVPNRFLSMSYDPLPLKPLAYKTQPKDNKELEKLHNIWLSAGYGNLKTPYIDAAVSTGRSKKMIAGLHGNYLSSQGKLNLQDFARSGGGAYAKFFTKSNVIGVSADYRRDKYYFYGFNADTLLMPPPENADSARQLFQTFSGAADFTNAIENKAETDYNLKLAFHRFTDNYEAKENNIIATGQIGKLFNEHSGVSVTVHTHYSAYKDTATFNNLLLNFIPAYSYRALFGSVTLGANAMLDQSKFYAWPHLTISAIPVPDKLEIYGIWKKELVKNNFMELASLNPFTNQYLQFQNSRREERTLGLKGNAGTFSYNLKGGQEVIANQPLFVNDSTDLRKFNVLYDKVSAWFASAEAAVNFKQGGVNLAARYNRFSTNEQAEAWHLFPLNISLTGNYNPLEKLSLQAALYVLNGAKAQIANGQSTNLKGTIDINLSARYSIIENIAIFANLNNIASVKAERFLYYPGYGFNALGGITVRF
ncbi:hypothetical protein C7N43_05455 [Sphingobacteriales bacterium UPWRP_1]|nr:hypothetical protein BVG80_06330 [Sphingobacteriales bacterium TSM_CSM]PSJ78025.1 hypothetical protein C7N43_05455 [Sphingobacteriales bacterium UPWRP_1]